LRRTELLSPKGFEVLEADTPTNLWAGPKVFSTLFADYYRLVIIGFDTGPTGGNITVLLSKDYAIVFPRICAKDTPVMRAQLPSIPRICVNPYPPYAWKPANFLKRTRKTDSDGSFPPGSLPMRRAQSGVPRPVEVLKLSKGYESKGL
jgi:hypothetical protein